MNSKYYIMINGKQHGPFSGEKIKELGLSSDTYVYNKEFNGWKKIVEVPDLNKNSLSFQNENPPSVHIEAPKSKRTHSDTYQAPKSSKQQQAGSHQTASTSNSQGSRRSNRMFINPFSFTGRIRRLEYGLTNLIVVVVALLLNGFMEANRTPELGILFLPLLWFDLAQGAKRCHDRDNTGWFQIIPFYVLWMLFAEGDKGTNQYGHNPK